MRVNRDGLTSKILDSVEVNDLQALRMVNVNATQLGADLVANRTPVIELNSSYGTTVLRDLTEVTGSGAIVTGNGTVDISTGATASSTATLSSAEVGRYVPGASAQIGIGAIVVTQPTGNQFALWGGTGEDDLNRLQFGYDATGVFTSVVKDGVETERTYQPDWNLDPLDGTGQGDYVLDVSAGVIFQIEFTWYGFGEVRFGVVGYVIRNDGSRQQRFIPCHSYKPSGDVSISTPNLRVFTSVDNGGDATDLSMRVGGRQYSIIGEFRPKFRFTGDTRGTAAVTTTVRPLISFRRKTNYGDRSIKVQSFEVLNTGNSALYVELRIDGTLTGATFGTPTNYTAAETALESDKAATDITGGVVIFAGVVVSAGQEKNAAQALLDLDFNIPNNSTVTLCVGAVTGTTDSLSGLTMKEEW